METLFVILLILSIYSYLLYPPLLGLVSSVVRRPWDRGKITPSVSIIISAYNEEAVIAEKLANSGALTYPKDLLEIIVSSDGSTDKTNRIVQGIAETDPRVRLHIFPRQGKTACLNAVVHDAKGEIILFTDANAMFPSNLLPDLVRNFKDKTIGAVTGWTRYGEMGKTEAAPGIYARLERFLKERESLVSSCVGADGAVFAIKKELFRALGKEDINDFATPLTIVMQGKRVVLDADVFCYEETSGAGRNEFARQARITNRTLAAIFKYWPCLNPLSFPSFSLFLVSHKLLRFMAPLFLVALAAVNILLLSRSFVYTISFAALTTALLGCLFGFLGLYRGKGATFASFVFAALIAQTVAWLRLFLGKTEVTWTPERSTGASMN